MRTLKPNYILGFLKMFSWVFGLTMILTSGIPYVRGHYIDWSVTVSTAVYGGVFLGVAACGMFTPREISWNDEKIILHVNFPKSGEYTWRQLEAYSMWSAQLSTFLLKFEGMQSYQIVPACFSAEEWRAFQSFLRTRFPEKKTWFWFGPRPVRFGKK